ncbi:MAG: FAD:protein FMN transferase [Clostridiales bacterium]|nr:FAD:protein FMN transferase [Clostridiales bacterium]
MIKRIIALILCTVPLLLSLGCASGGIPYEKKTFFAMNTLMDITIYGTDKELSEKLFTLCHDEITRQENLFSISIDGSDISKINKSSGNAVTVSKETANLIEKSKSLSKETDGAFDITVYPLVKLWGFYGANFSVPDEKEIRKTLPFIGYENIKLINSEITLNKNMGLDLGAIAKGYLGDALKEILIENGALSAIISLGGNITLVGEKHGGKPWSVAVRSPFSESEFICTLSVSGNKSVVTSGGYERFFEKDGKTYHHIIDTKTGEPALSDLASVTIIGEDGAVCDALSTALFVMGKEKALAFLKNRKELSYVLVTSGGDTIMSEDIS